MKLGAGRVLGLDVEEVAVQAARTNGETNGIGRDRFPLIVGSLGPEEHYGAFDGVFANIIARIIRDLSPYLYESVRSGGWLVASGIIIEREEEVRTALEAVGFTEITRGQMGDWVSLRAWRR
jgi:ribosomal protein L11 methyltransferase